MYFDSKALVTLISDETLARTLTPVIQKDWKRMTSPSAVIEAVLSLGKPSKKSATYAESQTAVDAFLDHHDIELRDMPPGTKLVQLAAEAAVAGSAADVTAALNAACVAYYEVEPFTVEEAQASLAALLAESAPKNHEAKKDTPGA